MPKRPRADSTAWQRVSKGGAHSTCDAARVVDEVEVVRLLVDRSAFRAARDFDKADAAAAKLTEIDICYNDDARQWYPRPVGSGKGVGGRTAGTEAGGAGKKTVDGKKLQRLKLLRRKKKRKKQGAEQGRGGGKTAK